MNDPVGDGLTHLMQQARAGDDTALARLLDGYRPHLSLLARVHIGRHLKVKLDGSDLIQETLVNAHRDFASFAGTGERELASWLRAIMAHVGANVARHYSTRGRDVRLEHAMEDQLNQSSVVIGRAAGADSGSSPTREWGGTVWQITFVPVPEPPAIALIVIGLLGFLVRGRRPIEPRLAD